MIYTAKSKIRGRTVWRTDEISGYMQIMVPGDIISITDPDTNESLCFWAVAGGSCTNCACSTVNVRSLREYCACVNCNSHDSPVHIEDFDKIMEEL